MQKVLSNYAYFYHSPISRCHSLQQLHVKDHILTNQVISKGPWKHLILHVLQFPF